MAEIICQPVDFGTPVYKEAIALRDVILRQPLGLQFSEEELAQESDSFHIVAKQNASVIGVIVLRPITAETIKMRQVAIAETHQRMGVGQQLVKFCEAFAKKKGFKIITLHARDIAIPFYLKLNYLQLGKPFYEVGIKHFKMEKSI